MTAPAIGWHPAIANGIVAFGTGASYLAHDDAEQGRLYIYEVPQP